MDVHVGMTGVASMVVTSADTAIALGSGDVPVLATPRVIALMEQATCEALRGSLEDSRTSVGTEVSVSHRIPTPVGSQVTARARVHSAEDRVIRFEVAAVHQTASGEWVEDVATGTIARVVVNRDRFGAASLLGEDSG
jgi:Predicted thioesterase